MRASSSIEVFAAIAVVAKDLVVSGVVVPAQPYIELCTGTHLLPVLAPFPVHVVDCQEHEFRLPAANTLAAIVTDDIESVSAGVPSLQFIGLIPVVPGPCVVSSQLPGSGIRV
jgi:hypothetical protein